MVVWLVCLASLFFFFRHALGCLFFPYPLHYREGVMTNWVLRLIKGASLYPAVSPTGPYLHNPYPPTFYFLVWPLQRVGSKMGLFFPGRLVSFLSLLAGAWLIILMVKKKAGLTAAVACGALFLFSPVTLYATAVVQPDTTGLTLTLASLFLTEKSRSKAGAIWCGLLSASALSVKPFFLAAALACGRGWMEKKRGLIFLLSFLIFLTLFFLVAILFRAEAFWQHFWQMNLLGLSWKQFGHLLVQVFGRHPFLLAAIVLVLKGRAERFWQFYWLLVLVALAGSLKVGAEENYYLEMVAAGSLAFGFLFSLSQPRQTTYLLALAQLFLYLPLKPAPVFTRTYGQEVPAAVSGLTPGKVEREIGQLLRGYLGPLAEPVICEDPGYLLLSGKEIFLQPYQFARLAVVGRWQEEPLLKMVQQKKFSAIIVSAESYQQQSVFFTPAFLRELKKNYVLSRIIGNYYLLEPAP